MTDILTIADFSAGLHAESDPRLLPDGSCQDCSNLVFHRGTLQVRSGRMRHARFEPLDGSIRALAEYQDPTDTLGAARLVAAVGTGLFASQLPDQTDFQLIQTGVLHPSNRPRMLQFKDWLYIVDGSNLVRRWKPGVWETLEQLEDLLKPTVAPVASVDIMEAEIGTCRVSDAVGQSAITFGGLGPHLVSRNMWYCSALDGDGAELWQGCARKFTEPGNLTDAHAESVGLEILSKRSPTGDLITGAAIFEQQLTADLDLSAAQTMVIRYKVHYTTNYDLTGVKFGFKETADGAWVEFGLPCDITREEWAEAAIDLTTVPVEQRDAVRYLRIHISGLEVQAEGRLENNPGIFVYPYALYAVTIVLDGIYVDATTHHVTQGDYEFTYSYDWDAEGDDEEQESGVYQNADASQPPYPITVVNDDRTFGFAITCIKDAAMDASHINVYARGGESQDLRRIGRLALNAETSYTLNWDGIYPPGEAPIAREYVEVPPAGCSLLVEWKGRMVYAKDDTIYISNWDNPVRTPLSSMVEKPMHYGGWYRAGTDGSAIVGMAPLGSYMLVMKENATVWRLEGEGGDAFTLLQISKDVDCLAHETIQQLGGNALAWLGKDTVTVWDGQEFRALGAPADPRQAHLSPIGSLLEEHRYDYGREVLRQAFSVYDPETRRYCLTLPMTLPFIWVPNNNGTVSKINTLTGAEVGRYHTSAPDEHAIAASPGGAVRSSNVVTITTEAAHAFVVAANITIEGVVSVDATSFNGTFTITTVADDTHFTYAQTAANDTGGGGTSYVRPSPSRTTVDFYGNCWVANRQRGTVVKIGLLESSMWEDRNEDGICQTSRDLDGDGVIGEDEILPWGEDECVLQEVVLVEGYEGVYAPGEYSGPYDYLYWGTAPRGIAVDKNNNAWVGTWDTQKYYQLDGITGEILQTVDVSGEGHKVYGAVIDRNGILWSAGYSLKHVLRMDTNVTPPTLSTIAFAANSDVYGMGLDRLDHLFVIHRGDAKFSRVNINDASIEWTKDCGEGLIYPRGVCVGADTDIWIACTTSNNVGRFDVNGNLKAIVPGFLGPTGVALDRTGRIWVTDNNDAYVHRILPNTNVIDLSKEIPGSLGHYTYSDMTGMMVEDMTGLPAPQGEPNAVSFVFEMETGDWTRWLEQPGGCALYSYRARLPGVYAGTRLVLGQYVDILRLMVGHTDATVESLAKPIAWSWLSQEFTEPGEGFYKDLDRVMVTAGLREPVEGMVAAIRANGSDTDNASRSLSVHAAPGDVGDALWRPPLIPDMASFSLRLAGESSDPDEIIRIKVYVHQRGRI